MGGVASAISKAHPSQALHPTDAASRSSYYFGKIAYAPNGHCGPRIQADYQLVVLLSGRLLVQIDDESHELEPGEGILQQPGRHEFYRFSDKGKSVHTWCSVRTDLFTAQERKYLKRTSGVHVVPASVHILLNEGIGLPERENEGLNWAMRSLARACILRFAAGAMKHSQTEPPPHPALERALEIISQHHAEIGSAEDLARRCGISTARLRQLFRQAGRESPSAMIWRFKAEHAIHLIRSTGLTLGEVSDQCGYANAFHLSRSVKQHTGCSPRTVRRQEWIG
jgi:AraC-like DNA-binding protein